MTVESEDSQDVLVGNAKSYADALREAREGVPHAMDDLVAEFSPMLWRVARRQGLDRSEAEDVVQNTWLALVRGLSTLENPDALPGWLVTTAKREAWRVRSKLRREQPVEQWDELADGTVDIDYDVIERLGMAPHYKSLWKAVGRLPTRCRDLLSVIAATDRPNYAQVARALGMPRGSIGPSRGRCLNQLRDMLQSDPEWTK
ncbi:RNA polymerase sigma factor (sigma-70 family) [Stackebrandtia endophytica]|uniref:RNA polymerase sigma factor (Sigma-70 family) n=1 Tax=Stackebrandtia endophytica TaxID=1496996 RepID=A0A543ATG8_9ACTN|nr:sigma-70 family RNA polymerase sigma factor [Stackebrandtia endophytica]TQL75805.1 RNA polymerase sigma factor (sigma-70 family) [Stackebrandtia endophytica]